MTQRDDLEAGSSRPYAFGTLALLVLALCAQGIAQSVCAREPRPLFRESTELEVQLTAPWLQLLRNRRDSEQLPATLVYVDAAGQRRSLTATVETRGLTRLRICRFPPIRLRFARAATEGTLFEGQRSLKLVTHCGAGRRYEQYYRLELLAYRIYNLITPHSYLTRPLRIHYLDPGEQAKGEPRFAFVLERTRDMARRSGRVRAPETRFSPNDFDSLELGRFMLFQYLIGNTDWSVLSSPDSNACCHNVRVTAAADAESGARAKQRIAVPYDLDSAGLVDTYYAVPHESLPIKRVSERLFRGFCSLNPTLAPARQQFLEQRTAILALVQSQPGLSERSRDRALDYVEQFFQILQDRARFQAIVSAQCRS